MNPKKWQKYPETLRLPKYSWNLKNDQNAHETLKLLKYPPKPKKKTEILLKPIKWSKYPKTWKLPKYSRNLKDDRNTFETYKMTKISQNLKIIKIPSKSKKWSKHSRNL